MESAKKSFLLLIYLNYSYLSGHLCQECRQTLVFVLLMESLGFLKFCQKTFKYILNKLIDNQIYIDCKGRTQAVYQ